jgi:hypothetical protein
MMKTFSEAIHGALANLHKQKSEEPRFSATAIYKELQTSFDMVKIKPTHKCVTTTKEWIEAIREVCEHDPLIQIVGTRYLLKTTKNSSFS